MIKSLFKIKSLTIEPSQDMTVEIIDACGIYHWMDINPNDLFDGMLMIDVIDIDNITSNRCMISYSHRGVYKIFDVNMCDIKVIEVKNSDFNYK